MRLSISVTSFASLIVAFLQSASAADLPRKVPSPIVAPASVWTGWYVGVNAGWIGSNGDVSTDAVPFAFSAAPINATNIAASATNQFNEHFNGFIGGAQFGYNYQWSPAFLVGFEADIQGSTLNGDASATNTTGADPFWVTTTTVSNRLDWLGTFRGRLGWIATPSFLLYATGGLAYGGVKSTTSINFNNTGGAIPATSSGSISDARAGWTAGAGLEWMFLPNWSAKFEYLHYDLGSVTYQTGGYIVDVSTSNFPGFGVASVATSTTAHFNGDIVRVGLNYMFH